jgi:hypothetical protein
LYGLDWIGLDGWEEGWMDEGFYKKRRRGNMNIYLTLYIPPYGTNKFIVSMRFGLEWFGLE